ncbi:MAG: glycosyl hydrolase [Saprospiraceae bacterium]|nr:glycosyl hydrolase [Saprospiraceae bacterium]
MSHNNLMKFILFLLLTWGLPMAGFGQNPPIEDELNEKYAALKWRNIGPLRGGRANAICGVVGNDQIYYAGYTGGGVWKTIDAGMNWFNISDGFFGVGSIGAIAVSEKDPNVVVVGTGEHAVRGVMTSYGDGVYKSTDAGKTWSHIGLTQTRHIANVIIHPDDYNTIYIGAQGAVHGPSEERGVYKSTDGGVTWKKTLYVDQNSGISSLVMDKSNPRIMYAATWQHRRYPWKVESGGPGSSIYKSTDGGENWKEIRLGLPDTLGKVGLSVSSADPNRIYAIVEAKKSESGLYRSDDAGAHWTLLSNDQNITARSWYYMEVFADPDNKDVVYVLNAPLMKSIDGGKNFVSMRVVHGDCHDLWINPKNNRNIAMAEDGGATITFSAGQVWSSLNNQPTAQLYRITADEQTPYWLYSGQQDNLSVAIPSRSNTYGILTSHWFNGPGCESAMVAMDDPKNPRILYGGCFNGRISLLDTKTKESKDIMAYPMTNLGYMAKDMKYRFNWNAPLINSPHDFRTMYYGGNVLFKSENGGLKWEAISPDLTKNDTTKQMEGGGPFTNEGAGGENYNTIYYIAESPHEKGVIYTGSDGGLIQLSRDGGATWKNITPAGLPETMIHAIEVSPHDPATVYFTSTRYKFNDFKNYSYKSTDYGNSWKKIGDDIKQDDFFRVVREDHKVPGLLYAGAERGFYISFDGGNHFTSLQLNLPIVPITDLVIRNNDLAASTAGRSFWILDDLSVFQQSKGELTGSAPKIFQPKPQSRILINSTFFLVTEPAYGENPAEGIALDYYVQNVGDSLLKMEIIDQEGMTIRTITNEEEFKPSMLGGRGNIPATNTENLPDQDGLNRFTWDFRTQGLKKIPDVFVLGADYRGHRVAPGTYRARLSTMGDTVETELQVLPPPDVEVPEAVWVEQQNFMSELEERINEMHIAAEAALQISTKLKAIIADIGEDQALDTLKKAGTNLEKEMSTWTQKVVELRQKGFQDALNWPAGLNAEFFLLRNNLDTYDPRIPEGYHARFEDLENTWKAVKAEYKDLMENKVAQFNILYEQAKMPALKIADKKESKP